MYPRITQGGGDSEVIVTLRTHASGRYKSSSAPLEAGKLDQQGYSHTDHSRHQESKVINPGLLSGSDLRIILQYTVSSIIHSRGE